MLPEGSAGRVVAGFSQTGGPDRVGDTAASVDRAYVFLDRRVDEAAGVVQGLPRSYTGGELERHHSTAAFTYDVALVVIAYCKRGTDGDLERAAALARTLLVLQERDATGDGRVRQSYTSGKVADSADAPTVAAAGSFTGAQAWCGLALLHAHRATGSVEFRAAAVRLGEWIRRRTHSSAGIAGYTGGSTASGAVLGWKSTEHNADVTAFFRCLAETTDDQAWSERATVAASFLDAMWDVGRGMFWVGSGADGASVNRSPVPEDPQTWSYLATGSGRYAASLDWTLKNLAAEDGGFSGVSFSDADTSKVWFEGTAHLAAALHMRNGDGDRERVGRLLASVREAQYRAPNADGHGIVAASADGLMTGDGDTLYASLHTGTTAWFLLAALGANPFVLG